VPEISRFFGIVIRMNFNDHAPPHFHARYGDENVAIEIATLTVIAGKLTPRALSLVMEWAAEHRDELLGDWSLAQEGKLLLPIEPLR
jgi:Domain of unknown function (DUF4160)